MYAVGREEGKEGGRGGGSTFNLGESTRDPDTFCFYILSRLSKTQWSRKLESARTHSRKGSSRRMKKGTLAGRSFKAAGDVRSVSVCLRPDTRHVAENFASLRYGHRDEFDQLTRGGRREKRGGE